MGAYLSNPDITVDEQEGKILFNHKTNHFSNIDLNEQVQDLE